MWLHSIRITLSLFINYQKFEKVSKVNSVLRTWILFSLYFPVETILLCILFGVLNLSIPWTYHEQCTQIHSKCSVHGSLANSAHISGEWKQLSCLQKGKLGRHGEDGLSLGGRRPSHCSLRWETECRKSVSAIGEYPKISEHWLQWVLRWLKASVDRSRRRTGLHRGKKCSREALPLRFSRGDSN